MMKDWKIEILPSSEEIPVPKLDLSLYLVIDPGQCFHLSPVTVARRAVSGGVSAVQVRSKSLSDKAYKNLFSDIESELSRSRVPIFVNDRVDVAAETVSDVHLGQDDMSVYEARKVLGDLAQIGLTVRSLEEAKKAPLDELSYVSVGAVFSTLSKLDAGPRIGIENLKIIVSELKSRNPECPVIAISGIKLHNLESVLETGVNGVALVSAICASKRPKFDASQFRAAIDAYAEKEY